MMFYKTPGFLFTLFLFFNAGTGRAQFTVMSFNLRYDTESDGENAWQKRKKEVSDFIVQHNPDFLGIQEGLYQQVTFLQQNLTGYDFIGKGRDDGDKKGEFSCIFYNQNVWKVIENNTFWLSPTPEKVSKGWDAALPRIFTFGTFLHRQSGETIRVINTHFDHVGKEARQQSARMILDFLRQHAWLQKNIIVMGDLNCEPSHPPIRVLKEELADSYEVNTKRDGKLTGTFNGFDTLAMPVARIDYILYKNVKPKAFSILAARRKNNLWLSDHCPVWAEFTF